MEASVWETLAENLPCEALSLPGHAGKKTEALLPSIEVMAEWIEGQIENYSPRSVILMGHSMGALIALEAAPHPAVAALVLIGAAARMPVHPDLLKQASAEPEAAAALILKWGVSSAHPEAVEYLKQRMRPETLANDLSACNAYQQGAAAARAINKPVLVLAGMDDKLTKPAAGQELADMLKNARFHLVSGSGHMLMVENPVEIAREIKEFAAAIRD